MNFKTLIRDTFKDFLNWLDSDNNNSDGYKDSPLPVAKRIRGSNTVSKSNDFEDNHRGINFNVYSATGGKVVSIRTYEERNDRWITSLYIVADGEDLGEELAHIITRESLTR
jgi:hypothetical protein